MDMVSAKLLTTQIPFGRVVDFMNTVVMTVNYKQITRTDVKF